MYGGSASAEVNQAAFNEISALREKLIQSQKLLADSTRFASS